jgi:hypothetical protein
MGWKEKDEVHEAASNSIYYFPPRKPGEYTYVHQDGLSCYDTPHPPIRVTVSQIEQVSAPL